MGDENILTRRKSEKEKREETEIIELLKHMHQLDRNELIARIQQRDQYIVCIIGAIVAILVGLFQVAKNSKSEFTIWLLCGCLVVWIALVILTYRLINSYQIHDKLIEHTQEIDQAFRTKYKENLSVLPWQDFVNTDLPGHRQKSCNYTIALFIFIDFSMLLAWTYVAMLAIKDLIGMPPFVSNDLLFSIIIAFTVAVVSNLFLWESDVLKPKGISIPQLLDHGSKILKEILLVFLPFLFASLAVLFAMVGTDNNIFPKNTIWGSALLNVIAILCMRGSKKLVCKIAELFSTEDTDGHTDENITLIHYILIFVLYAIYYLWVITLQEAIAVVVATIGMLAFISLIRDKPISSLKAALIAYGNHYEKKTLVVAELLLFSAVFLNNIADRPLLIINDVICGIAVGTIIPSSIMLFLYVFAKRIKI